MSDAAGVCVLHSTKNIWRLSGARQTVLTTYWRMFGVAGGVSDVAGGLSGVSKKKSELDLKPAPPPPARPAEIKVKNRRLAAG